MIEGFYGRSWSISERTTMLDWIRSAGMNLYVYGPKDDIKIRARWRALYTRAELRDLKKLVVQAKGRGIEFMAAVSPCVDITHGDPKEVTALCAKLGQFLSLGIRHIALLFDDIPSTLNAADAQRFASFSDAQAHVVNACNAVVKTRDKAAKLYFCPTEYCSAMASGKPSRSAYLSTIGIQLAADIEIFWTGLDIVSETITAAHCREVAKVLRRKPFIWDNFHANDYDIRRVYSGPLGGREQAALAFVSGWMTNPNNELEANFVPVHTTGQFFRKARYSEAAALQKALADWQPRLGLDGSGKGLSTPLSSEQLLLLVSVFYQPFAFGPKIRRLLRVLEGVFKSKLRSEPEATWRRALALSSDIERRLEDIHAAMTELKNRELFHTYHQYLWEARHELRYLNIYLRWCIENSGKQAEFPHGALIYNFYRKGFTAALNDLIQRDMSGRFRHGG
ncbi:MAG: beta-N-acetylglucosaminidase domain-containing protein [Aestuariivirga sp.]